MGAILHQLGRTDIPFFKGAERPFVGQWNGCDWPGHGNDGLGNSGMRCPVELQAGAPPAAAMLCHMVDEKPNHYDILTLGPLTNLAIAVSLDPAFFSKVKSLTIMGGTTSAQGNTTLGAEFNFHSDAEAAAAVLERATPCVPLICTWELALQHKMTWEFFDHLVSFGTDEAQLLKRVASAVEECERSTQTMEGAFSPCDAYAAAALLQPQLIQQQQELYAEVELGGKHSKGGLFFDWMGFRHPEPNVKLVHALDQAAFERYMELTFSAA